MRALHAQLVLLLLLANRPALLILLGLSLLRPDLFDILAFPVALGLLLGLLLFIDEGVEPLEGIDQLSGQAKIVTLKLLEVLLIFGKLSAYS